MARTWHETLPESILAPKIGVVLVLLGLMTWSETLIMAGATSTPHVQIPVRRQGYARLGETEQLRYRKLGGTFKEIAEINREGDGVYWADLRIGSPPQQFSVIVDTGSSSIAVPCQGCKCGDHNHFDTSNAKILPTRYSQCYSEGSCNRGKYVQAMMCLGGECDVKSEGVEHRFGCCSQYASAFQRQEADGIIGMSGESSTLIADLRNHHKLESNMFSLCLSNSVGVLGVGGFDESRHLEPVQWTPLLAGSFYKVKVTAIGVGDQSVEHDANYKPIVDSGTTFTYLPRSLHAKIQSAFMSWCEAPDQHGRERCLGSKNPSGASRQDIADAIACWGTPQGYSKSDLTTWLESFPPIQLVFPGMKGEEDLILCLPPSAYFFKSGPDAYCVGLLRDNSKFVLGALTMSGFDVIFDHDKQRLGMARSICNKEEDNVLEYRKSQSFCCGSCADAQDLGYNIGTLSTARPTLSPTTASPTLSPVPEIKPGSEVTPNGLFNIERNVTFLPGKEVITPINGKAWTHSNETFTENQVLQISMSAELCKNSDFYWKFEPGSSLFISGANTIVELGPLCKYSNIQVSDGATVSFVSTGDERSVAVEGKLSLLEGKANVNSGALLKLLTGSVVETSAFSELNLKERAQMECGLHRDNGILLSSGTHTFEAPSVSNCYLTIGPTATLKLITNKKLNTPINAQGTLQIQGTLDVVMSRSPFTSFALLTNETLIWDQHFQTTYRLSFDSEGPVTLLPEKARVMTVAGDAIQDNPTRFDFPPEFECANVQMSNSTIGQLYFTAETCFNQCAENPANRCSKRERERWPWPPKSQVDHPGSSQPSSPDSGDTYDNTTLAVLYKEMLDKFITSSDVETKGSFVSGLGAGAVVAIMLLLILHPPRLLARFACCCRRRQTYDAL